jgi:hypothetical protein
MTPDRNPHPSASAGAARGVDAHPARRQRQREIDAWRRGAEPVWRQRAEGFLEEREQPAAVAAREDAHAEHVEASAMLHGCVFAEGIPVQAGHISGSSSQAGVRGQSAEVGGPRNHRPSRNSQRASQVAAITS